jgi:lipopolysaccharide export system protein LptA
LRTLHGEPDAKIVGLTPGQPDKVSTSHTLDVAFNPDGGINSVVQRSNVRYNDAQRSASANEARYTPDDENLVLTGSPRWTEAGGVTTARVLKLNRQTGDAFAEGEVKTVYRETRSQPGGALLGSSEPIHVTADNMTAHRQTSTAVYSGSARLWQGSSVVEAPTIEFDRTDRVLKAKGARQPVLTVFVQDSGKAKGTPVTVASSSLDYSDQQHRAVFRGAVLLKSADGTVSADNADVLLKPRGQNGPQGASDASQIEEIVADGHVVLQQPSRRAVGNTMTYTAADGKYVMTGNRPSIFDAEHGVITGDSLTFYSRDDTVLVGSGSSTRTVTQTHTGK